MCIAWHPNAAYAMDTYVECVIRHNANNRGVCIMMHLHAIKVSEGRNRGFCIIMHTWPTTSLFMHHVGSAMKLAQHMHTYRILEF